MANTILAHPDWTQADPAFAAVAFSGGGWQAGLPVSNLGRPEFAYLARSTNLDPANTQVWADLGVPRDVLVAAVPRSNCSRSATMRIRGCTSMDTSTAVCDSGVIPVYPIVYPPRSLYYGHSSWWDGKLSAEDAALFPMPWYCVFKLPQIARYWLLEINDPGNPAGYVQLPRLVLAPGYQPSKNLGYGATLAIEDPSVAQQGLGGAKFFDKRTKGRVARFELNYLPTDEALVWVNDMMQRLGTSGQLFFIWNPDTPAHAHRRNFLARMRSLSPLQAAVFGRLNATYELEEVLG